MDSPGGEERLTRRGRRALTLIAIALVAIVVTGVAYLRPALPGLGGIIGNSPAAPATSPAASPLLLSYAFDATYDFLSPSLGWALVSGRAPADRFWVFRTDDGARHWQLQLTGPAQAVLNGSLEVRFFDHDHGLISLGDPRAIYRTSDGGSHWKRLAVPPYLSASVVFSDAQHGWILGYAGPNLQPASRLVSTTDGGDTWTVLPQVPTSPFGGKGGEFSTNFAFRNPYEGWLGGLETQAEAAVYSSIDGGVTWQPHPLPATIYQPPERTLPKGVSSEVFVIPGAGVMAVTTDANGNHVGLTSFDGGSTWRRLPPPPGETSFEDYVFEDTFHWWASRYGTLFKSSDAGQSWKEVAQGTDEWDYLPGIIDSKHAWAQMVVVFPNSNPNPPQGTGLAMSSDGGVSWTPVDVPQPV